MKKILIALISLMAIVANATTITIDSFTIDVPAEKMDRLRDFIDNGIEIKVVGNDEDPAHKILGGDTVVQADAKRVAKLNWRINQLVIKRLKDQEMAFYEQQQYDLAREAAESAGGINE
jgi:hypothetical protein